MTIKNLIVQTKGLCKTYGPTKAVLDLELSLFEGEFVGLVGHNGA